MDLSESFLECTILFDTLKGKTLQHRLKPESLLCEVIVDCPTTSLKINGYCSEKCAGNFSIKDLGDVHELDTTKDVADRIRIKVLFD